LRWNMSQKISDKNIQLAQLFGNSVRSKIIAILLKGKEMDSKAIIKSVNLFGEEYKLSIIRNHLTDLKKKKFVIKRREGRQSYWKINNGDNEFLQNLVELMKAPKRISDSSERKERRLRKSSEKWEEEIFQVIASITTERLGDFSTKQIKSKISIDSQRLSQILKRMIENLIPLIGKKEGERGMYFVTLEGVEKFRTPNHQNAGYMIRETPSSVDQVIDRPSIQLNE
jgi:predicted transcriptional regulator